MARQLRATAPDIVYHVLNRANAREGIFQKEKDYAAFERILLEAREKFDMRILAFCIMPNHWHLILHPKTAESLSQFMRWITHTHTQRYHTHYHSIGYGHVYQGRYKSFPVQDDDYFLQVCRYVERNPIRAGLAEKIEDWQWSSSSIRKNGSPEQRSILSEWPIEKPGHYEKWANTLSEDEEEKLEKIRHALKRGSPFGESEWMNTIAEKLGLESTLRKRGRPKKGT
ncbi:MAG: transposase [Candidatus Moranbacteria bacterium]|nr:transposase [Candidatus Moranbacteria bacterium]